MRSVFIALVALFGLASANDPCTVPEAQESCGQCIKQHPQCGWCGDPHAVGVPRCQSNHSFTPETCNPNYVFSPKTEIRYPEQTLRLESLHQDGRTVVRLEPQQVFLKMKHGDKLNVPFKYLHSTAATRYPIKDFYISTSDYHTAKGISLKFFLQCNGKEIEGRICPSIQDGQAYEFRVEVTMDRCINEGDISISVGVYGHDSVSGVYITPLCGCECEKLQRHEKNSPLCHNHGTLICGQCNCDPSRGGDRCECPLQTYGVRSALELDQRCRSPTNSSLVCSGRGTCHCGTCECKGGVSSGKFCECDSSTCPTGSNGSMCSGNGACECGNCNCEPGWEREDCSCRTDKASCMEGGVECSGNGHCECGRCICHGGFTGAFCGAKDEMVTPGADGEAEDKDSSEEKDGEDETESGAEGETKEQTSSGRSFIALLVFFIPLF